MATVTSLSDIEVLIRLKVEKERMSAFKRQDVDEVLSSLKRCNR